MGNIFLDILSVFKYFDGTLGIFLGYDLVINSGAS